MIISQKQQNNNNRQQNYSNPSSSQRVCSRHLCPEEIGPDKGQKRHLGLRRVYQKDQDNIQ